MSRNSEAAGGDIATDLAALRQDVARLAESMSALMQGEAQGAAQRVTDVVDHAKATLSGSAAGMASRATAAGEEIEARIERHPLTAVLIAFGVGMALGLMSRSRA